MPSTLCIRWITIESLFPPLLFPRSRSLLPLSVSLPLDCVIAGELLDDEARYWTLREQRPVTNHPLMVGAQVRVTILFFLSFLATPIEAPSRVNLIRKTLRE